jgi:hypothetical protein
MLGAMVWTSGDPQLNPTTASQMFVSLSLPLLSLSHTHTNGKTIDPRQHDCAARSI